MYFADSTLSVCFSPNSAAAAADLREDVKSHSVHRLSFLLIYYEFFAARDRALQVRAFYRGGVVLVVIGAGCTRVDLIGEQVTCAAI